MTGRCNHYRIEADSVVIGPTWSSPKFRNQGIATYALRRGVNVLLERGRRTTYIDTRVTNQASLRVIEKAEYGAPMALVLKIDG